jgi:hypothetical protein
MCKGISSTALIFAVNPSIVVTFGVEMIRPELVLSRAAI